MLTPIFLENDAIVRAAVTDADGAPVTTATVSASVLRIDGTQLGEAIPMPHAEGGIYTGAIPDSLGAVEGEPLDVKITATAGTATMTLWIAARARKRRVIAAPS